MRVALALLLLPGCESIFPLEPVVPPGTAEACGVQEFEPLRYILNPQASDWASARSSCQARGYDLAVFDTPEELLEVRDEFPPAYWLGVMGDPPMALDECEPALDLTGNPGVGAKPGGCVAVVDGNFGMAQLDCTISNVVVGEIHGLCEALRPSIECATVPAGPYSVVSTDTTYTTAAAMCSELVQINTIDEIALIEDALATAQVDVVWVAPQYRSPVWSTIDGCPSIFPWAVGQPTGLTASTCAAYRRGVGLEVRLCDARAAAMCEH